MSYLVLIAGIVLLIVLIAWARINAFIAFLLVAILIGLFGGLPIASVVTSIQKGLGDILSSLLIIIALGAMLGKLVADSGAALRISTGLIGAFGKKYIVWALVLTCFIIGVPLFYNVAFVLAVPLVITIAARYKIPAVYIGLPALSALSVTHGYLPPHPSPVALVQQFHADMGVTLLYGVLIAVPAIVLAGPVFATTLKKYKNEPVAGIRIQRHGRKQNAFAFYQHGSFFFAGYFNWFQLSHFFFSFIAYQNSSIHQSDRRPRGCYAHQRVVCYIHIGFTK